MLIYIFVSKKFKLHMEEQLCNIFKYNTIKYACNFINATFNQFNVET